MPPAIAYNREESSENKDCNLNSKPTATTTPLRFSGMQSVENSTSSDLLKVKNRNSFCLGNGVIGVNHHNRVTLWEEAKLPDIQQLISSEKTDLLNTKMAVTPSSPMESPRYSLLVATGTDTSSENSSALNTPPPNELDPLLFTSGMSTVSGLSLASTSSNQIQQMLLRSDYINSYLNSSRESLETTNVSIK